MLEGPLFQESDPKVTQIGINLEGLIEIYTNRWIIIENYTLTMSKNMHIYEERTSKYSGIYRI